MTTAKNKVGLEALPEKEEKVLRIKLGLGIDPKSILPRKTQDEALLAQLFELERSILARAPKNKEKKIADS